jgi:hypothetical protein
MLKILFKISLWHNSSVLVPQYMKSKFILCSKLFSMLSLHIQCNVFWHWAQTGCNILVTVYGLSTSWYMITKAPPPPPHTHTHTHVVYLQAATLLSAGMLVNPFFFLSLNFSVYIVHSIALCCAQCFFAVHMKIILLKQEKFVVFFLSSYKLLTYFFELGFFANNVTTYSVWLGFCSILKEIVYVTYSQSWCWYLLHRIVLFTGYIANVQNFYASYSFMSNLFLFCRFCL